MKKGLLVYNRSYITQDILNHIDLFKNAFSRFGFSLDAVNGLFTEISSTGKLNILDCSNPQFNIADYSFCLFWDKDICLAESIQELGLKVFNPPKSIRLCDNKALMHIALCGAGLNMPNTVVNPLMYRQGEKEQKFVGYIEQKLGYPMVAKELYGSQGLQVELLENRAALIDYRQKNLTTPHLYQKFLSKYSGTDLRYYVAGGKVCACLLRKNPSDFRSNLTGGGFAELVKADNELAESALTAARLLGLTFGAGDFIKDDDGNYTLCEVNSNPAFGGLKRAGGIDFSEKIAKTIAELNNI